MKKAGRTLQTITLFTLLLGANIAQAKDSSDWTSVYKKIKPSIPYIFSNGGLCSGALVSKRLILTAKHCVESLRPTFVAWPKKSAQWEHVDIIFVSRDLDFALLELQADASQSPIEIRSGSSIEEGEAVATVGHPTSNTLFTNPPFSMELTHVFSAGYVSKNTGKELVSDLSISPGNSGGPLFDKNGEIVGVVSRKVITPFFGNVGYSVGHIPIEAALLLEETGALPYPDLSYIPPDFSFGVQTTWDSFQNNVFGIGSTYRTDFAFEYTMADRLFINYTNTFGLHGRNTRAWGLGYKLHYLMGNAVPYVIKPQIRTIRYESDNELYKIYGVSYGAELGVVGLPMGFQFHYSRVQGTGQFVFAMRFAN